MKNAVIYARYSSHSQNEMSIEGQVAECRRYASEHDLIVVQEYIDRAQSATTDKRPNFIRMIEDSEHGAFDIILVYQFDRFARNVNDAGYYRKILADRGVSVISAMERIPTDSSGIITQGMIDAVNQWYSAQLSEKVTRGMRQRAEQFKYNGGNLTYGFDVDKDGHYILNPITAPIVKEIFERVASGETTVSIANDFNKRGIKTVRGNSFGKNSLQSILRNERYKGTYVYADIKHPNAIPRIVSDELFDEVQELIGQKRKGHRPAIEDYLLSGKLYCGHCKDPMNGTSGNSHTGKTYRYYKCANSPKRCDKRTVKKEFIEDIVLETCRRMLTDEVIDNITQAVAEQNERDQKSPVIANLQAEIKDAEKKIERLIDQIESGTCSGRVADRLRRREDELERLKKSLRREIGKQKRIDPIFVRRFLKDIRDSEIDSLTYNQMLVNSFIDRIYLYDDHFRILLTHSGKDGKTSKGEAAAIEYFFDTQGSITALDAPPQTSEKSEVFLLSGR